MRPTKTNKYQNLSEPQAVLDFHGIGIMSKAQIEKMCLDFLEKARREKKDFVLIVTGKGLHSRGGEAVVKPIVHKVVQNYEHTKSVMLSRRDRGGEGAYEVKLFV